MSKEGGFVLDEASSYAETEGKIQVKSLGRETGKGKVSACQGMQGRNLNFLMTGYKQE